MTDKGAPVKHNEGDRIKRLVITKYLGKAPITNAKAKNGFSYCPCYEVLCDCGKTDIVTQDYLRYSQRTQQCRACSKKKAQTPWRESGRKWTENKALKEEAAKCGNQT